MPLKDLIPHHLSYCISKLYEGYWSGYPLAEMDLGMIADYQTKIKAELDKKYGSYKKLDNSSDTLESIDYVLMRLQELFSAGGIKGNKDAKVFIDALDHYFDEVKEMFAEIDNTGWHPDDPS